MMMRWSQMTKGKLLGSREGGCRCGECIHAIDRNSDGWQKGVTNVPPGASRVLADHNVKMFLAAFAMSWMGSVGGGCMTRSFGEAVAEPL